MTKTKWHYGQKTMTTTTSKFAVKINTLLHVCVSSDQHCALFFTWNITPSTERRIFTGNFCFRANLSTHGEIQTQTYGSRPYWEWLWGGGDTPESNINKNHVNAEALAMRTADSAQPCLITVHLGQRPNGRLGCRPRQTTFHLASTVRKSWVWLMRAYWSRRSTNG